MKVTHYYEMPHRPATLDLCPENAILEMRKLIDFATGNTSRNFYFKNSPYHKSRYGDLAYMIDGPTEREKGWIFSESQSHPVWGRAYGLQMVAPDGRVFSHPEFDKDGVWSAADNRARDLRLLKGSYEEIRHTDHWPSAPVLVITGGYDSHFSVKAAWPDGTSTSYAGLLTSRIEAQTERLAIARKANRKSRGNEALWDIARFRA